MSVEKLYLRIIAGTLGGRKIDAPPAGSMTTRPTLDRVRESLFDILARRLDGVRVLDLCAGTGALGLESISRGAKAVTFVESDPRNVKLIQENIAKLNVGPSACVVKGELPYALGKVKGPFEVVFFDPPYSSDLVDHVMPRLATKALLAPNAIIVVERDRRSQPIKFPQYAIDRRHRIGDTELWFMRHIPGVRGDGDE